MFGLFKKKKKLELFDLDGECRLIKTEEGFEYESLADGRRVSWLRMIDAATERQKVRLKQN